MKKYKKYTRLELDPKDHIQMKLVAAIRGTTIQGFVAKLVKEEIWKTPINHDELKDHLK